MRRRDFVVASLASLLSPTGFVGAARASYPDRAVRLIIPRGAGGVLDVVGRHWCNRIAALLGSSVYIENIAGAGGMIGMASAAKANPDGFTLLLGSTSDLVLTPLQQSKLSFDADRDFQTVSMLAVSVGAIAVHAGLPVNTLQELIAYAKANPDKLNYASVGAGTMSHLINEQFRQLAGLPEVQHVPYKSGATAFNDLVSGVIQVQGIFVTTPTIELHRAGKIKILAAASPQRVPAASEIPTTAEAGMPNFIAEMSFAIFAPRGTPEAVIRTLHTKTQEILSDAEFGQTLLNAGFVPIHGSTPASTAEHFARERKRWLPILASLGLKQG
jgi:tripartite-type tricarboxylate transporter receptor subunit TctC